VLLAMSDCSEARLPARQTAPGSSSLLAALQEVALVAA
jgi:hypothetical protein